MEEEIWIWLLFDLPTTSLNWIIEYFHINLHCWWYFYVKFGRERPMNLSRWTQNCEWFLLGWILEILAGYEKVSQTTEGKWGGSAQRASSSAVWDRGEAGLVFLYIIYYSNCFVLLIWQLRCGCFCLRWHWSMY